MGEFQEKYKVDIAVFDATGSTTEKVSQYFDMLGYRRIDFIAQGRMLPLAADTTRVNIFTMRLLSATNNTGGGSTAISSATAIMGKQSTGVSITSTDKVRELILTFTTRVVLGGAATVSILGQKFKGATGATAAYAFAGGASAQATVASEGFVAAFNLANNTLSPVWEAATMANSSSVRIYAKDPNNTVAITATGTTIICLGVGRSIGHLGLESQHLKDGQRYVAICLTSSGVAGPISILAIREAESLPVTQNAFAISKTMGGSTSK
jgi:hypothetical protein